MGVHFIVTIVGTVGILGSRRAFFSSHLCRIADLLDNLRGHGILAAGFPVAPTGVTVFCGRILEVCCTVVSRPQKEDIPLDQGGLSNDNRPD